MSRKVFVAPLPRTYSVDDIKAVFVPVGEVVDVHRPRDKETGEYRKFAFITLATPELAQKAVEVLHGSDLEGEKLSVTIADERPAAPKPTPQTPVRPAAPRPATPTEFEWELRISALLPALENMGKATTAKMTLVGRPGHVVMAGNLVMVTMEHTPKPTGYPKGIPTPPNTPTTYTVYIALKQWKRVAEAIQNPEDILILEGACFVDPDILGIALFATNVNTKLLQQASRPQASGEEE